MPSISEPPPRKQLTWGEGNTGLMTSASFRPDARSDDDPAGLSNTAPPLSAQQLKFNESSKYSASAATEGVSVGSSPKSPFRRKVARFLGNQSSRSVDSLDPGDPPALEQQLESPLQPALQPPLQPPPPPEDDPAPTSRNRNPDYPPPPPKGPRHEDNEIPEENPHSDIDQIKSVVAELQLNEAKRQLSELKKTKINQETYDKFIEDLDQKGLKLDPGSLTKMNLLRQETPKDPIELLKDAKIEFKNPIKEGELLKTLQQRKDTASTMDLRDEIMKDTGREFGPDIAFRFFLNDLKQKIFVKDPKINTIINENSSITEVLNVLAFLINKKDDRESSIMIDFSVKGGTHNKKGEYANENGIKDKSGDITTVFDCLNGGTESPFNIETLQSYTTNPAETTTPPGKLPPKIILPAGILKRKSDYTTQLFELNPEEIQKLFIACVLQMIHLLQTTREVFGGWAKLFKGMNGGGGGKSKSKKTRRRNRNRY